MRSYTDRGDDPRIKTANGIAYISYTLKPEQISKREAEEALKTDRPVTRSYPNPEVLNAALELMRPEARKAMWNDIRQTRSKRGQRVGPWSEGEVSIPIKRSTHIQLKGFRDDRGESGLSKAIEALLRIERMSTSERESSLKTENKDLKDQVRLATSQKESWKKRAIEFQGKVSKMVEGIGVSE